MSTLNMLFFFLTVGLTAVEAADIVVIHSNGTQIFSSGQLLDSHTPVDLPAEAKITVVFASGGIQKVSGPYQGKLQDPLKNAQAADNNLVTALAQFLIERETIRSISPQPEDIWLVNVSTSKRFYCVEPSSHVILWRTNYQSRTTSTLIIKHEATGQKVQVTWPASQTTLPWPNQLPIIYGDTYTLELKSNKHSSLKNIVLYQLPES